LPHHKGEKTKNERKNGKQNVQQMQITARASNGKKLRNPNYLEQVPEEDEVLMAVIAIVKPHTVRFQKILSGHSLQSSVNKEQPCPQPVFSAQAKYDQSPSHASKCMAERRFHRHKPFPVIIHFEV